MNILFKNVFFNRTPSLLLFTGLSIYSCLNPMSKPEDIKKGANCILTPDGKLSSMAFLKGREVLGFYDFYKNGILRSQSKNDIKYLLYRDLDVPISNIKYLLYSDQGVLISESESKYEDSIKKVTITSIEESTIQLFSDGSSFFIRRGEISKDSTLFIPNTSPSDLSISIQQRWILIHKFQNNKDTVIMKLPK